MSNDNVERIREGYEAFGKGDLETLRDLFSPDIVWHASGNNPLSGDYRGVDEVFGYFGNLFEITGGDLQQEVHDLLANDEHGIAITRVRASRSDGRTMDMNQVGVFHMNADRRITEAWIVPEDQKAGDEFLA